MSGTTIGQFRENNKLIDIVMREPLEERATTDALNDSTLPTGTGKPVTLSQIARAGFVWEPGVVWREGREWAITVQSRRGRTASRAPTVSNQVMDKLAPLIARLPAGYTIKLAGAAADSKAAEASIAANVPLVLFIVFTLLMLQLHSFSRALMVFLTGPLGVAGAAMALLILHRPFGFVANLGVIALFGMVIRNSVILVDQIEHDIAPRHAAVERHCRSGRAALPAHHADGGRRGAGHDSAVAFGVLGADGGGDHGRAGGGDGLDFVVFAGAVCGVVQGQAAANTGTGTRCLSPSLDAAHANGDRQQCQSPLRKCTVVAKIPVKYRVDPAADDVFPEAADQVHPAKTGCDPARMAKLVDAPGLGPDASNGVGVRVPLLAPRMI